MIDIDGKIRAAQSGHREALIAEKQTYERIHTTTKAVLAEVGIETKNETVIELLEATGLAAYDATVGRIYLLPELVDLSLDAAAKTFVGDEGINTLGIGGIPPFLYREGDQYPMPATYEELAHLIELVGDNLDVVRFLSQPVKVHKGDPLKCNQIMDRLQNCIKVTCSAYMDGEEAVKWFAGRDDWHDSICGVKSPLICMDNMMDALIQSARAGNNLRLTTMPLAGRTAPQTPEACIVITHAEVMFMLAVAQAVNPGMLCMFGGMPCTTRPDGDLDYSHDAMDLLNVAVARLNMWVTKLPTVQSGGSTAAKIPDDRALADGIRGRRILCGFGVHTARHCFGVLDNLNFFSEKAFLADCQAQREYLQSRVGEGDLKPLYLPPDAQAFDVIERVASADYHVDYHTTANLGAFDDWARDVADKGLL
ncbi:MAG: trimethylamine methyltransferase family protein [Desulfobacteraceae bacterium]|jgi:trimethylamine--corrinoid protein Co-methyltransferase|nr:trimethylamine methyltransferase family protein [Desulfobacteraceae bacterium]